MWSLGRRNLRVESGDWGVMGEARFERRVGNGIGAAALLARKARAEAGGRSAPPPPEREPPGMLRRVRNAVAAAVEIGTGALRDGRVWTGTEAQLERKGVCLGCDWYRRSDDLCAHPGCGCPIGRKSRYLRATCPAGKWKGVGS